MPNRGEDLARRALIQNARAIKKVGASTLPAIATVASVEGDTVTVRVSGAEEAEVERIGFLSATVNVGDRGIILPIKDGGRVFARSGSALTSDDLPVTQADPAAPTKTLTQKLAEIAAEEQRLENEKAATTYVDNEVTYLDNTKRNTADPIPQADVTNLVNTLSNKLEPGTSQDNINGLVTALNNKRSTSVSIPQGDVTNLVTALANKLEPGTSQSNISGLVNSLNNKASTTTVQAVDATNRSRRKTSNQTFTGSGPSTCDVWFSVGFGETWHVTAIIAHSTSATDGANSGVQFGLTVPSGWVVEGSVTGVVDSGGAQFISDIPNSGGLAPVWFTRYAATFGFVKLEAIIRDNAGTATGLAELVVGVADPGDTLVVKANTSIIGRRIAYNFTEL